MARYNQLKGTLNVTIGASNTAIPGLDLTRQFDDGEVLILIELAVKDLIGIAPTEVDLWAEIDNELAPPFVRDHTIAINAAAVLSYARIRRISAGVHNIKAMTLASAAGRISTLDPNAQRMIVIQMPLWDSATNITE